MDGKLITTNLHHINMGLEELVEHSYYDSSEKDGYTDPLHPAGNPLGPNHPWNTETKPRSDQRSWKDRYTWSKRSSRWTALREPAPCAARRRAGRNSRLGRE